MKYKKVFVTYLFVLIIDKTAFRSNHPEYGDARSWIRVDF